MDNFYIVCAWDNYYPSAGIGNIVLVTTDLNQAKKLKEKYICYCEFDNCEVYESSQLPWQERDYEIEYIRIQDLENYSLKIYFDEGPSIIYSFKDDIENITSLYPLKDTKAFSKFCISESLTAIEWPDLDIQIGGDTLLKEI